MARLRKWKQKPGTTSEYNVTFKLVNAANYSVPQKRLRVFFVGIRADQGKIWQPPAKTHSSDALLLSQWGSSEYWERHKVATRQRPPKPAGVEKKISALIDTDYGSNLLAWRTVRDAIADLPDSERFPGKVHAHRFRLQLDDAVCRCATPPAMRPVESPCSYLSPSRSLAWSALFTFAYSCSAVWKNGRLPHNPLSPIM
nr:DNA cytosine methyltransferase [uncultured Duganella sp.]